jgi:C1A family cysteine protease
MSFVSKYGKKYKSDEEFFSRFQIFKQNLKIIADKNAKYNPMTTYAVNKFADLSKEEFKHKYLMTNLPPYEPNAPFLEANSSIVAPTTFDWRTKGATTPVKDQGQCGSCWAFSATENIESVWQIAGNNLPTLGPQQIVDCDKANYGCSGGWPYVAFQYVTKAGGQDTEASYPYTARDGTCKFKTNTIGAKINNYKQIGKDETQMQQLLTTTSPFSVCVDAEEWSFYSGGIITPDQCGRSVDHCVQLIGYDATTAPGYWICRNSWGTDWGLSGFINLQIGGDTCLIADYVTSAIAKTN